MKIVSEQSTTTKLRIAPADWANLSDEEAMAYILEMRGQRGKAAERKTRATKDPSTPTLRKNTPTDDIDDIG